MIAYARQFRLTLEDVIRYFFGDRVYPGKAVVSEFRSLVDAMRNTRNDLRRMERENRFDV